MTFRRLSSLSRFWRSPSLLSACADAEIAGSASRSRSAVDDPLEPMNRTIFDVNDFLDRLLIRPLAELYRFAIPDYLRERIANVCPTWANP